MKILRSFLFFILPLHSLLSFASETTEPGFDFLDVTGNSVQTYHSIKSTLGISDTFRYLGEEHYTANYHGHPFEVNVAAFLSEKALFSIHAEKVSDNSGYLDYSYMEQVFFEDRPFRYSRKCLQLTQEQVDNAPDLHFFKQHGFDFSPHIRLEQFFIVSEDKNSEIVFTYATKHNSCDGTEDIGTTGLKNIVTQFVVYQQ